MRLLLLRHGIAEEREAFARAGGDDRLRPLTDKGRRRLRRISAALAQLLPELSLVATSPLVRARESAEILVREFARKPVLSEVADLAPEGTSAGVLRFLQAQKALPAVAAVGHEPALSHFAGLLLCGKERSLLEMKKGSACLIDFPGRLSPGGGVLLWHLPPTLLKGLT